MFQREIKNLLKFCQQIQKLNKIEKEILSNLNPFQISLLAHLKKNHKILKKDAIQLTNISRAQKYRLINFLIEKKIIKKKGKYFVI